MSSTTIIVLVILVSIAASFGIASLVVQTGRRRAEAHIASLGPIRRSIAAASLGLTSPGAGEVRSTGTLVLTADEVAFAQWRPERFLRISLDDIVEVDTTREHLGRTLKSDVLRLRWRDPQVDGGEQGIALFVRDLDEWVTALGVRA